MAHTGFTDGALSVRSGGYLETDFPLELPQPRWLQSNYSAECWRTTDENRDIRFKIFFNILMSDGSFLAEPQHFHLLDTVRRMSIGYRTGPFATVSDASVHMAMTNAILTWVLWMDLNGVSHFSRLTREDLEAYTEKAIYGTSTLLDLPSRIRKHISNLRQSGVGLPKKGKFVDVGRLFEEGKIYSARAVHDRASLYEIFKVAHEDGIYLKPNQLEILRAGPVRTPRISKIHLLRLLQPWEYQWQMRRVLPGDKITFDPFPLQSISKTVEKLGVQSGRTKTIPVPQAMFLIDRSIRWVLDYSQSILQLIKQFGAVAIKNDQELGRRQRAREFDEILIDLQLPQGPGQPWPMKPRIITFESETIGISGVLHCLFASCFVVIAAFTARRHREVTSCRGKGPDNEYCITSDENGFWIELWIEKTVQEWDKTPCPEVVVKAVEVLNKLSESARAINGKPKLFQYKSWGSNETASVYIRRVLLELTNHLDIPPLADGSKWRFEPRQLRRFFAMMYIWRYEFGELSALSYQLRHYNLDMTRRYCTEPTQGKIFREVETEHTVSILKEVALGRRDGSGPFGERFKKTAQKIRSQLISKVHVFTEEKFAKRIERLILRSGKILKGFPWGYCTCGSSSRDLDQAKCLNSGDVAKARGPDKTKATVLTCANCPHHFTHEAFRPYAITQMEFHEKASQDKNNGHLVRNASATFARQLREYINRSFKRSATVRSQDGQENEKPSPSDRTSKPKRRS